MTTSKRVAGGGIAAGRVELNGLMRADRKHKRHAWRVVSDGSFTRYQGSAHAGARNERMQITFIFNSNFINLGGTAGD